MSPQFKSEASRRYCFNLIPMWHMHGFFLLIFITKLYTSEGSIILFCLINLNCYCFFFLALLFRPERSLTSGASPALPNMVSNFPNELLKFGLITFYELMVPEHLVNFQDSQLLNSSSHAFFSDAAFHPTCSQQWHEACTSKHTGEDEGNDHDLSNEWKSGFNSLLLLAYSFTWN